MHNAIFSIFIRFKLLIKGSLLDLNSKRIPIFAKICFTFLNHSLSSLLKVCARTIPLHIFMFKMLQRYNKSGIFQRLLGAAPDINGWLKSWLLSFNVEPPANPFQSNTGPVCRNSLIFT